MQMKVPGYLLALATVVGPVVGTRPLAAQAAPRVATALGASELAALEVVRRDVWVHWFAGDTASLRRVLAPELVAITSDSPQWQSLDETIKSSVRFKESGGRLESVTFDSTRVHLLGEVVVMFSHYAIVTVRSGARSTQKGRATEVFVRTQGRWVHTSWHLDAVQ
jgi:Domain of unknown function (DUF4440)